jgi:hypothetical protein
LEKTTAILTKNLNSELEICMKRCSKKLIKTRSGKKLFKAIFHQINGHSKLNEWLTNSECLKTQMMVNSGELTWTKPKNTLDPFVKPCLTCVSSLKDYKMMLQNNLKKLERRNNCCLELSKA